MSTVSRGPGRPASPTLRSQREEEILDAAVKLFAERGYSNANTQELADLLGVGKGTLYRYFPTKQELFLAAADRVMARLNETIDAAAASAEDPLDRMASVVRAYLNLFAEHPEYVELLILERAQFKDRPTPTYFVNHEANTGRWQAVLRKMIAAGRIRDIPVDRITDVIGAMVYGTMFTNYFARRNRSLDEQVRDIVDIAFHGILSDSERQRRGGRVESVQRTE